MRISPKRVVAVLLSTVLIYLGSYLALSVMGGYMVNESGRLRVGELAECDQFIWMPYIGFHQRFIWSGGEPGRRSDAVGWVFAPLILTDQAYIHRTIRFMNDDLTFVHPLPAPPLSKYHPRFSNPFWGRFPYERASETNAVSKTAAKT